MLLISFLKQEKTTPKQNKTNQNKNTFESFTSTAAAVGPGAVCALSNTPQPSLPSTRALAAAAAWLARGSGGRVRGTLSRLSQRARRDAELDAGRIQPAVAAAAAAAAEEKRRGVGAAGPAGEAPC